MDFTFTDEQESFRASVRELLAARYPVERVASIADGDGFDAAEWTEVAHAGWTSISVPEAEGGAGLGLLEEMVVAEEAGRALYPGPFLATVVMALPLLRAGGADELAGAVASGERIATVAPGPVPGTTFTGGRLTAQRTLVPNLDVADVVVVVNEPGDPGEPGDGADAASAWVVDRAGEGVRASNLPTVDRTRSMGHLELEAAPAIPLAAGPSQIAAMRDRTLAALAAEACGVASRALELAVAYAGERRQFGRPIGSFQAVAHELARAYMDVETSRSLAYWAGWCVAEGEEDAPAAAAAAKARAAEAAVATCERAIQVHGGIGFTWEHPLHRFYKRALAIAAMHGTSDELWSRVAGRAVEMAATGTPETAGIGSGP